MNGLREFFQSCPHFQYVLFTILMNFQGCFPTNWYNHHIPGYLPNTNDFKDIFLVLPTFPVGVVHNPHGFSRIFSNLLALPQYFRLSTQYYWFQWYFSQCSQSSLIFGDIFMGSKDILEIQVHFKMFFFRTAQRHSRTLLLIWKINTHTHLGIFKDFQPCKQIWKYCLNSLGLLKIFSKCSCIFKGIFATQAGFL